MDELELLKKVVDDLGSQRAAARKLGLQESLVSRVLNGEIESSYKLTKALLALQATALRRRKRQ